MEPTPFSITLGQNLKRLRLRRGWTAKVVAAKMGMTMDDVYKIEAGLRMASADKIMQAADVLNCNLLDIYAGLDPRQPDVSTDELRVLSANSSATMRWLATKWTGDIDALIAYLGTVALFPENVRQLVYMDSIAIRDDLISKGIIQPEQLPPATAHMEEQLGRICANHKEE